ncbi:hypothetical protein [Thiocystis violascens]|uniref:hypothetical protein n=1 Tax=Thiocystis violascens TaxID=73141 RepID=UPI0012F6E0B0|nr:hypothetical protein [Thiocystis violascens]
MLAALDAIALAVEAGKAVIPVLLPSATSKPTLPAFLSNRTWVEFKTSFDESGIQKLIWGITGQKQK